jgi:hypothetical protein
MIDLRTTAKSTIPIITHSVLSETKAKPRSATIADETARNRLLKAMNGDYDEATKRSPPSINHHEPYHQSDSPTTTDNMANPNQETNQVVPIIQGATSGKKHTSTTEDLLALVSETHAPKHMTWEMDNRSKSRGYDKT